MLEILLSILILLTSLPWTITLPVISTLLIILIPLIRFFYNRHRKLKAYYEIIWKKSSKLKPDDVLEIRGKIKYGYHEYYYRRPADKLITDKIENNKHVLIIGNPLAGKSRSIYQVLKTLKKPLNIIIPKVADINLEDFRIPFSFSFWRESVLLLDDIDKFAQKQNFTYLLQEFLKRNALIIASCRSGPEYDSLSNKMERDLSSIFDNPIEIHKISREEGEEVAKQTGTAIPSKFDGNIGSIFLQLDTMKERFKSCSEVEKAVLRSIKRLYFAGIYREREIFTIERIKYVCKEIEEIEKRLYQWNELLKNLQNLGFIEEIKNDEIWAEETYLEFVIEGHLSELDNLDDVRNIFSSDPDALLMLGKRAFDIGSFHLDRVKYMKIAIESFEDALEVFTTENFPREYAIAKNSLGGTYIRLAEVENRAENCKKAINNFEEALNVFTFKDYPIQFAMTRINLGGAYGGLAEEENKAQNYRKAVDELEKALSVLSIDFLPIQYAMANGNLGTVYSGLAEEENRSENSKKAIKVLKEALRVFTLEIHPVDYAMTKGNLAKAYGLLAEIENKTENYEKAIVNLKDALEVFNLKTFPLDYAKAQGILGNIYSWIAKERDTIENCEKAIKSYKEALRVYTADSFPLDYAKTQNNLGITYVLLAEEKDTVENCEKAIKAYKEALIIYTPDKARKNYGKTQNNLGVAYGTLANVKDKKFNCEKAIKA
ncbi:MAG: tetratricopeptide repeat protein, partial [Promethearchaeota archaeon]